MANDKEFLIRVRADIQQAVRQMGQFNKELGSTAREGRNATQAVNPLTAAIRSATGALGAYLSLRTAVEIVRQADAFNVLDQRVRSATRTTGDYVSVNDRLFRQSQANGVALSASVELFQNLARVGPELGETNERMLDLVNLVQQLGIISGAAPANLNAGLLQFSQGLAAGVFRAEEFNSLLENIPEVANRIAKGLNRSVGELRALVLEGKLLSVDVFNALISQAAEINAEFQETPDTVGRAGERLANAWGKAVAEVSNAIGLTDALVGTMNAGARLLETGRPAQGNDLYANTLNSLTSAIPFVPVLIERSDRAKLSVADLRDEVERLQGVLEKLEEIEFPGPVWIKRREVAREDLYLARQLLTERTKADRLGQRAAEAQFGSGKPPEPAPPDPRVLAGNQKLLEALQLQADTLGQTAEQVAVYRLAMAGATPEQLAQARALEKTIRNYNEAAEAARKKKDAEEAAKRAATAHQEKVDAVAQAAREALDPWERYREELDLLEEALQRGLNPDAYRARIQAINDEINGLADTTQKTGDRMSAFAEEAARGMQQAFSAHFFALLQGETDNLGARFKAMLDRMAADLVASQLLNFLLGGYGQNGSNQLGGLLGAALSGGGGGDAPVTAATGGYIRGPGTPTSDSIPARLSDGEYVVRAASVARYGVAFMDAINGGRFPSLSAPRLTPAGSGFADGGLVSTGRRGGGGGVVVNQYISTPDANSFRRSEAGVGRDTAAGLSRAMRRNG